MIRWMLLKVVVGSYAQVPQYADAPREGCPQGGFLTFPPWYRGITQLPPGKPYHCGLHFEQLGDIWTIVGNVFIIIVQLAGLLAVLFIIYGGIRYITSQGEPENLQSAKKILTNAIIGLIIAILAVTIVGFIAGVLN